MLFAGHRIRNRTWPKLPDFKSVYDLRGCPVGAISLPVMDFNTNFSAISRDMKLYRKVFPATPIIVRVAGTPQTMAKIAHVVHTTNVQNLLIELNPNDEDVFDDCVHRVRQVWSGTLGIRMGTDGYVPNGVQFISLECREEYELAVSNFTGYGVPIMACVTDAKHTIDIDRYIDAGASTVEVHVMSGGKVNNHRMFYMTPYRRHTAAMLKPYVVGKCTRTITRDVELTARLVDVCARGLYKMKVSIIASGNGGMLAGMIAYRMRWPMYSYMNTPEEYADNGKVSSVILFYDSLDDDDQYTTDIDRLVREGVQRDRILVVGAVSTYSIVDKPITSFFDMYDIMCNQWVIRFPNVIQAGSVSNLMNYHMTPGNTHTYYIGYIGPDDVARVVQRKREYGFKLCTDHPCIAADYILVRPQDVDSQYSTPCILATDGTHQQNILVERLLEHPCVSGRMLVRKSK